MSIALVTGGASGLGLATARRFAADGFTVVVADLDEGRSVEAAKQLPGSGHRGVAVDIADEASVEAAFEKVESGVGPVAVLACFAGIGTASGARGALPIVDTELDEWEALHAVNARGTFLCIRAMLRHRISKPVENGRIITVASMAGQVGGLQSGGAYSASKGAVLAFTKSAAREAAALGITVNAIAPGPIDSPLLRRSVGAADGNDDFTKTWSLPLGRIGKDTEIAAAAAYLASPDSGFVTGSTIDVNGGLNLR